MWTRLAIPKTDLKPKPFSPVVSISVTFELWPVSQIASTSASVNPRSFDSITNSVGLIRKVIEGRTPKRYLASSAFCSNSYMKRYLVEYSCSATLERLEDYLQMRTYSTDVLV